MGMIGSAARQAARIASMGFLGVDPVRQKQLAEERAKLEAANRQAAGLFNPVPGDVRQAPIANAEGGDITAAFGPVFEQGPSRQRTPVEIAQALAKLQGETKGFKAAPYVDIAAYAKPEIGYDRGFGYDKATGAPSGGFHPELDKGQQPYFDSYGRVVGVGNLPGAVQSAASMAGAVTGAQEAAKAPYNFQTFKGPGDRPVTITGATAAALGAGGGPIAVGSTPAELSAEKIQGDAAAQGGLDLPKLRDQANMTLQTLAKIRKHPSLDARTGNSALLPALRPQDVDFDALVQQVGGGAFLEAISYLRGTGQITEIEGQKATQAIARMTQQRQSKQGFLDAMNDYESVVRAGAQRAEQRAGGAAGGGQPARSAPAAPPAAQRQRGQYYQTPRGPLKWTGTGWVQ